jgi:hypothetical protein
MKTSLFTLISGLTLAGLLTLTGAGVLGSGPVAHATRSGKLEGTWLNSVKIVTCPPAPYAVIVTLQSMQSYLPGGVIIEAGGPAGPPPAVSRSGGLGIWEQIGPHTFRGFFRFHSFDNLGRLVRISDVTSIGELIQGDDPETPEVEPYYLSGTGTNMITNLDPVTGAVINVTQGCNESKSRPMLFPD